jgi:hypothetical protein
MNLELTIERLILPDLPPVHRERVAAAIEQELARLWAEQGSPPGLDAGAPITLHASSVQSAPGARPEAIGAQVAQSIYSSLAGSEGRPGWTGGSTK